MAAVIAGGVGCVLLVVSLFIQRGSWSTVAVGLLALGASLASAAAATASLETSRRSADAAKQAHQLQLFERARAAHTDLTSGPVAAARGRLGAFSRAQRDHETARHAADTTAMTKAAKRRGKLEQAPVLRDDWFTLLWCFQRLRAVDDVLVREPKGLGEAPREFLWRLVGPQLGFLNHEATYTRAGLEELLEEPVDDAESKQDFIWLVEKIPQAQTAAPARPGDASAHAVTATWAPHPEQPEGREPTCHAGAWADTATTSDRPAPEGNGD